MNLFQNPFSHEATVLNSTRFGDSLDSQQILWLQGNTDVFPLPLKHKTIHFFQIIVKLGHVVRVPEPGQFLD